eukprot:jgi/Botrbrau1/22909/Bobra.0065s0061.2
MSTSVMLNLVGRNVTAFSQAKSARHRSQVFVRATGQRGTVEGQGEASRREAITAGLVLLTTSVYVAPAHAIFGLGGPSKDEVYQRETNEVISAVKTTLALDRDDPTKADAINALRKQTNDWVAKYRRDASFAGRPSYGNTYSALNAIAGHYNSFGADAPLPKKRLERVQKEIDDAERLLGRGR